MTSKTPLFRLIARDDAEETDQGEIASAAHRESLKRLLAGATRRSGASKGPSLLDKTAGECLALTKWELMLEAPSMSLRDCQTFMEAVAARIAPTPKTALSLSQNQWRAATGLAELDQCLSGGVRTGQVTELVGRAGTGKSQFCMMMTAHAVRQGRGVLYLDSERKFTPERLRELVIAFGGKIESVSDAMVIRCDNKTCSELIQLLKSLEGTMSDKNIGLVVVDSVAAVARGDNVTLVERQRLLAVLATELKMLAETFQVPVVVTNQVLGSINSSVEGGDIGESSVVPALGNTWHHVVNVRLFLSITYPGGIRRVRITKSPDARESEIDFVIDGRGISPISPEMVAQASRNLHEEAKREFDDLLANLSESDLAALSSHVI